MASLTTATRVDVAGYPALQFAAIQYGDAHGSEIIWSDIIFVRRASSDVAGVESGHENGVIRFGAEIVRWSNK